MEVAALVSSFWCALHRACIVCPSAHLLQLDYVDFGLIVALLLVNASLGFWEENNAGNAIAALKAKLAPNAKVLRDGEWKSIPARELVPGDILRIRWGAARRLAGTHSLSATVTSYPLIAR